MTKELGFLREQRRESPTPQSDRGTPSKGMRRFKRFEVFQPVLDSSGKIDPRATFNEILSKAPRIERPEDRAKLGETLDLALKVHDEETRKDGIRPYIVHPLGTLHYLTVCLGGNVRAGCDGILHDVQERSSEIGLSVNRPYLAEKFGNDVADDVAYVTHPKCIGPVEDKRRIAEKGRKYKWAAATNGVYDTTKDYFKSRKLDYPPEVYAEMRELYLRRLLTAAGIIASVVKIGGDVVDNLQDLQHLKPESIARKLEENRLLARVAIRYDWDLFSFLALSLKRWNIEPPISEIEEDILRQQKEGVIVIPKARGDLDFEMATRELPVQYPGIREVTVWKKYENVHKNDILELDFPRTTNGHARMLEEHSSRPGLEFSRTRSLFYGVFDLDAKGGIIVVRGLRKVTMARTMAAVDRFIDGTVRKLQEQIAKDRTAFDFADELKKALENGNGNGSKDHVEVAVK